MNWDAAARFPSRPASAWVRRTRNRSPSLDLESLRNLPVLIVDDNATNRKILHEMLCHWQMAPTSVACAADALALLRERHAAGTPFRLVLTDVNMPEVDGFMLCERIRGLPELANLILVVLTSGDRCRGPRPVPAIGRRRPLVETGQTLGTRSESCCACWARPWPSEDKPQANLAGRRAEHREALRVLLAEDSLMNQKLAVGLLTKWGHTVHVVANGRRPSRPGNRETFDLILMDVQMPEMNGLEATAAIRQREAQTGGRIPDHRPDRPSRCKATATSAWPPAWTATCPSRCATWTCSRQSRPAAPATSESCCVQPRGHASTSVTLWPAGPHAWRQ